MIRFSCPACASPLRVSDDGAGKLKTCPNCSTPILAPVREQLADRGDRRGEAEVKSGIRLGIGIAIGLILVPLALFLLCGVTSAIFTAAAVRQSTQVAK